jgi:hypothetical protein
LPEAGESPHIRRMQQTVARVYAALLAGVRVATAAALVLLVAVVSASVVVRYFGLFGGSLHLF